MKKIILVIFIILLTGCIQKTTTTEVKPVDSYRTGNDGITLSATEGMPPSEIYEGENFKIGYEVRNDGAADAKNIIIKLYALGSLYFEPNQAQATLNLKGKSPVASEGERNIVEFAIKNRKLPYGIKTLDAPYEVSVEYKYETIASTDICINPNVHETQRVGEELCRPTEQSLGDQGAPVAVRNVKSYVSTVGNRIISNYDITIKNVGDGKVKDEIINMQEVKVADKIATCNKVQLKLKDEETTVRCSVDIDKNEGIYTSILNVKFDYDYKTIYKDELRVKS